MGYFQCIILTLCLLNFAYASLDQAGEEALENVLQQILQIKPGMDASIPDNPPEPPKHMLELYQSYTNGAGPTKSHWGTFGGGSGISMVRSILPSAGNIVGNDLLVFNLSSVRPREVVLEAQLHLHRKRLPRNTQRPRQHLPPPYRIRLLHAANPNRPARPLSSLLVSSSARGWHVHTITDAVRACRRASSSTCFLEVKFEEPKTRGNKELKIISTNQFLHENGAFLLLYSEDEYKPIIEAGMERSNSLTSLLSRARRSIHDNELPGVTEASTLAPSMTPRRRPSTRPQDEPNTIPYPHSSRWREGGGGAGGRRRGGGGGGGRKNRRRGHRKTDRKLPDPSSQQNSGRGTNPADTEATPGECHVNKLSVNFEDFGWEAWIIAPKTIDVNYCAGRCDLPMKNSLAANNHAVIQGFLHMKRYDVPAPCCVSEQLSSVNVMSYEDEYSVVLRMYHNMTVQSCRCR